MANDKVNVLVFGSGGREHALLAKLAASPRAGRLWSAPGNGGTAGLAEVARVDELGDAAAAGDDVTAAGSMGDGAATVPGTATAAPAPAPQSAPLDECDPAAVAAWAVAHDIGLVVIGPEAPLVAGVADAVRAAGIPCFGPGADGARMEGSKRYAKEVMARAGVPTAAYQAFSAKERAACEAYVREVGAPVVIKADGLAAGKGVVVAATVDEALVAVAACFDGAFGEAGATVVVEECMEGPECSLLALTDGHTVVPLATSQDHKRALDGDRGPNTGGMGVYSPVPAVGEAELASMVGAMERVVAQLAAEGVRYSGCLYGGFMLTSDGPRVLEFNARFGDPETQVVLPRMRADLLEVMLACDAGSLSADMVGWADDCAVCVVLASEGYPGAYEVGREILGLDVAGAMPGVTVYHAGTARTEDGRLVTAGGRVLGVTAVAPSFEEARERAYAACDAVTFEGKTLRRDIALRAL